MDHLYRNNPQKLQVSVDDATTSDHSSIDVKRYTRAIPEPATYWKFRNFRDKEPKQVQAYILIHPRYNETLQLEDSDKIAENIIDIITEVLDQNAPIVTKQITTKLLHFVTRETRMSMVERD